MDLDLLIAQCKKQNPKAQEALFLEYRDALYNTSLKYCRNTTEAQDNVHDAFVIIFETIKKYSGKGSFQGWMQRITINQAVKKYRNKTKEILTDQPRTSTPIEDDSPLTKPVQLDTILTAIQELPNQYRLVFNLYTLDNYSHKQIAKMLQISVGTSKSNLHRAKQLLKAKLTKFVEHSTK